MKYISLFIVLFWAGCCFAGSTTLSTTGNTVFSSTGSTSVVASSGGGDYSDIIYYHNCDALGDATKSAGSATVTYSKVTIESSSQIIGAGSYSFNAEKYEAAYWGYPDNFNPTASRVGFYFENNAPSAPSGYTMVFDLTNQAGGSTSNAVRLDSSNKLYIKIGGTSSATTASALTNGVAYFIEVAFSETQAKLYVDGVLIATITAGLDTATDMAAGSSMSSTEYAVYGLIDQIIISNDNTRDLYALRNITNFN